MKCFISVSSNEEAVFGDSSDVLKGVCQSVA